MKKLIYILTAFILFTTAAKAQETPPAGLKSVNGQFYINLSDSSIWQNKGAPYGWHRVGKFKGTLQKSDSTHYVTPYYFNTHIPGIGDYIRNTSDLSASQVGNAYLSGSGIYAAGNLAGQYSAFYNLGFLGSTGTNQFALSADYLAFQHGATFDFKLINDTTNNETIISGDPVQFVQKTSVYDGVDGNGWDITGESIIGGLAGGDEVNISHHNLSLIQGGFEISATDNHLNYFGSHGMFSIDNSLSFTSGSSLGNFAVTDDVLYYTSPTASFEVLDTSFAYTGSTGSFKVKNDVAYDSGNIAYVKKTQLDSLGMLISGGGGTVTSITPGIGFTSHTAITTSGTMNIDTANIGALVLNKNLYDIPNKATARTNLSVYSQSQTASLIATAVAGLQPSLGFTPENVANKKTSLTNSATDYPSTSAVKAVTDANYTAIGNRQLKLITALPTPTGNRPVVGDSIVMAVEKGVKRVDSLAAAIGTNTTNITSNTTAIAGKQATLSGTGNVYSTAGTITYRTIIVNEVPTGTVNGVNTLFTTAHSPITGTFDLKYNGVSLRPTTDYSISGTTITTTFAPSSTSGSGSLLITYNY